LAASARIIVILLITVSTPRVSTVKEIGGDKVQEKNEEEEANIIYIYIILTITNVLNTTGH
jgi:hypothetical protein